MMTIAWGPTIANGKVSEVLQQAKVKLIPSTNFRCVNIMTKGANQFCTIGINENIST